MFGSLKGMGDIGKLMSQAQEMQRKAAEMQESLEQVEVEGSSGAGMVAATATAKGRLKRMRIDPSLLVPEEAEVLEDLIVAAVADAQEKAQVKMQEEMQKVMGDLPIPPGMMGQ